MSALLESITLGQAVTALAAIGSAVVVVAGLWWRSARAYSSVSETLKGKAEQSAVDAMREAQRERCAACRREVDAALERKASKAEVIEHTATLAEHRESLAAIRAEMSALSKGIDGVREDLRRLTDRLERWMEREP